MEMNNIVTSIELTKSGIKLVSGYVLNNQVYVLYKAFSDKIPSDTHGLLDEKILISTLTSLLNDAKNRLKELGYFVLLISPDDFQVVTRSTSTYISSQTISQKDYYNCSHMLANGVENAIPSFHYVYVDPITFISQECGETVDFPIDKRSNSLGITADIHMIPKATLNYYLSIFEKFNIVPYLTLVSPFSSSSYLLKQNAPKTFYLLDIEKNHSSFSFVNKRHFNYSKQFDIGLNDIIEKSKNILNVDYDRMSDLIYKFGLDDNVTFQYFTDEKLSLTDISSALKQGFSSFSFINDLIKECEDDISIPIILLGDCKNISSLGLYLGTLFNKKIINFSLKVIGAREDKFLPCIGGISITSNTYMNPMNDKKRHNQDNGFSNVQFNR